MNLWLGLLLMLAQVTAAWAAEPRLEPTVQEKAQTLVLLHEPIVMLQAKFGTLDHAGHTRQRHVDAGVVVDINQQFFGHLRPATSHHRWLA